MKAGILNKIIQSVKDARGIDNSISSVAIRCCSDRKKLVSHHGAGGKVSPMLSIEHIVVEIMLRYRWLGFDNVCVLAKDFN